MPMQPAVSIYNYSDPVDYLAAAFQQMQERNPHFSLRAWAKQLGLSHVAMLSMVLNRKRRLLPSLSSRIGEQFVEKGYLSDEDCRYFDVLVLYTNARSSDEKTFYQRVLSGLRPDREFSSLALDQLRTIADWYHIAILEMTFLKDFQSDPRWISLRLGDGVNETQVKEAIERLLRLGLLEQTADGRLRKTSAKLETSTDIPSQGLRKFHADMLRKATQALEGQSLQRRDITGYTLVISREKLPEAKRMIQKFRRKLANFLETPDGNALYQFNVQLFELTERTES